MKRKATLTLAAIAALVSLCSLAGAEVVQHGGVRIHFAGELSPKALPRTRPTPVHAKVAATIAAANGDTPPKLRSIAIAINRYGRFDSNGLPHCQLREIQPATTENALAACRRSLVGEGRFSAKVQLSQQAPFPASGKVYAFNGSLHGRPAIFAHVYGTDPVPTSFTLPFELRSARGTFGTVLHASLSAVTGNSGYITGISLDLGRRYTVGGKVHSYLSESCPAPGGFSGASFPFAKASFGFGGKILTSTLTRSCKVR